MGKIRCRNCGRKVDSGFDYCPQCGTRLEHEAPRQGGGCGRALLMVTLCCLIIAGATAATVWLVREKDREDERREIVRQRRDSLKAAEVARLRHLREEDDSLRAVAREEAERRQIESQTFTLDDFVEAEGDGVRLRERDAIVRSLRERGYSTIRREADGRCTVMGLNAEVREGKIAGRGSAYSAAGLWQGRVELIFSSVELADGFVSGAPGRGFKATDEGETMRTKGEPALTLTRRNERTVTISE